MTTSRRALLGLVVAAAAGAVTGCSRARSADSRSSGRAGPPESRTSSPPAATSPNRTPTASARPSAARSDSGQVVAHGPRTRPEVALTFHGSGDPTLIRELLGVLAAHRVHVTVLAVGTWLEQNPRLAREVVAAGHELGNHTYRHLDINALDPASARAEIVRCRDALRTIIGSGGGYFRQSQAPTPTTLVRTLAAKAGYPVCLSYDVDSLDYTDPGPRTVRQRVAAARPGSIVSLHFGHRDTVLAMPGILADLAVRRLQPVTASRLLRP